MIPVIDATMPSARARVHIAQRASRRWQQLRQRQQSMSHLHKTNYGCVAGRSRENPILHVKAARTRDRRTHAREDWHLTIRYTNSIPLASTNKEKARSNGGYRLRRRPPNTSADSRPMRARGHEVCYIIFRYIRFCFIRFLFPVKSDSYFWLYQIPLYQILLYQIPLYQIPLYQIPNMVISDSVISVSLFSVISDSYLKFVVISDSVISDSVISFSTFWLYHIPLYLIPLY